MPGTLVVKAVEANLTHDTDLIMKMDPYVQLIVGEKTVHGDVCKKGGKHPTWNDSITVERAHENYAYVEVMDKDRFTPDAVIGVGQIDLNTVKGGDVVAKWFPLYYRRNPAGEILLQIVYTPTKEKEESGNEGSNGEESGRNVVVEEEVQHPHYKYEKMSLSEGGMHLNEGGLKYEL